MALLEAIRQAAVTKDGVMRFPGLADDIRAALRAAFERGREFEISRRSKRGE